MFVYVVGFGLDAYSILNLLIIKNNSKNLFMIKTKEYKLITNIK